MRKLTTEEFVKKAKKIHGEKYDYSLVDYKSAKEKIKIICHMHSIFEQLPYSHIRGKRNHIPLLEIIYDEKDIYTIIKNFYVYNIMSDTYSPRN